MKKDLFQTKYLLVALIVLVVLGFTAVLLQNNSKQPSRSPLTTITTEVTPSLDPTANWKTYTNENFGLEFKYPQNWKLLDDIRSNRVMLSANQFGYILSVKRIDTTDNIENWWQKNSSNNVPHDIAMTEFNSIPAYIFTNTSSDVQVPMDWIVLKMNGYLIQIEYEVPFNLNLYQSRSAKEKEAYSASNERFNRGNKVIIDQILSTFKFTN